LALSALLAVLAQPTLGQEPKLKITAKVYKAYQDFLSALPKGRDSIFVVTDDGERRSSYICTEDHCDLGAMIVLAMSQCVDETQQCEALFVNGRPQTPFEIAP
jgi:hypothetical protein